MSLRSGKGSKRRPENEKKITENWDKIFKNARKNKKVSKEKK